MNLRRIFFGGGDPRERLGRTIARNAFWLTGGDVVNRLLKFLLIAYTTRVLPVEEFGAFTFSLNLLALTFIAGDLGVSSVLFRRLSETRDRAYLSSSFVLTLGLIVFAAIATAIAGVASNPRVTALAFILIFMMIADTLKTLFLTIHNARNRMDMGAIANTIETGVTVLAGFIVLVKTPSAEALAWMYVLGACAALAFVGLSVRTYLPSLFSLVKGKLVREIFTAGWPLALGGMGWGLMATTDSLILGWIRGLELAAFYNAAGKIIQFLGPIGGIIVGATFPPLVATKNEPERHRRLFERTGEMLFAISLPIVLGGIIVAKPLIQTIYGANYVPAAFVFSLLLLNIVQTSLSFFFARVIFAHDHQMKSLLYIVVAWIVNVGFSITLIPIYGMTGAALANLVGQTIVFTSHSVWVKRAYGLSVFSRELIKPLVAAIVMAAGLLIIRAPEQSPFLSIPFGALLYGGVLLSLKPKIFDEFKSVFRRGTEAPPEGTFY